MFSVARHQRLSHSQRNEHILPRKIPSYGFLYSCCPVRSHLLIGHNETLAQSLLQFVLCMRQRLQMDCAIAGEKSVMGNDVLWQRTFVFHIWYEIGAIPYYGRRWTSITRYCRSFWCRHTHFLVFCSLFVSKSLHQFIQLLVMTGRNSC